MMEPPEAWADMKYVLRYDRLNTYAALNEAIAEAEYKLMLRDGEGSELIYEVSFRPIRRVSVGNGEITVEKVEAQA